MRLKRKENPAVSPSFFVEAWQRSDSIEEVCERTGANRKSVLERARNYADAGVRLKPLVPPPMAARGRRPLDVAGLNELIDAIASGRKSALR